MRFLGVLLAVKILAVVSRFEDTYPCSDPTIWLACLKCDQGNIASQEECEANGNFRMCYGANPVTYACYEKTSMSPQGEIISYEHGCIEANKCCGNMWSSSGECTKAGLCGDALYTCERCYYGCPNITSNCKKLEPVAAWRFDNVSQGKDISLYAENPVNMTDIVYGEGPDGQRKGAAWFPGADLQRMIIENPSPRLQFSTEMTFITSVLIIEDGNQVGPLFMYSDTVTNHGLALWVWDEVNDLSVEYNPFVQDTYDNVTIPYTWSQVALVVTTDSYTLYVNGTQVANVNGVIDIAADTSGKPLHVGRMWAWKLYGRVACSAFYDVALNQLHISDIDLQCNLQQ